MLSRDVLCAGAGEDVEQAMLRLTSQATETALLRDRQAQLDKDYKVIIAWLAKIFVKSIQVCIELVQL